METTFTELRSKEVINALTGKILGNICDVVMDLRCNRILGFVVPGSKNFFSFFKPSQEIFIPFSQVCRIGEDIILVEISQPAAKKQKNKPVRVFEAQEQSSDASSKNFLKATSGEAKSIYPTSAGIHSNASAQQSAQGYGNVNSSPSFQTHNFANGQASYPMGNVMAQCSNCSNAADGIENDAHNDSSFDKYSRNIGHDITGYGHDDVYPIN